MRVVLSIQEGKISSATPLRRLWTYSRDNNFCKAFREVGRVIGTVQLLRFLSGPQLRRRTTAETSKVESCNRFSDWCRFGNHGVIAASDPDEQEKILKFSTLLTNAVIFRTILDMMTAVRELIADGWSITLEDLAVLSPYLAARIQRFGVYATDEITTRRPCCPGRPPTCRRAESMHPAIWAHLGRASRRQPHPNRARVARGTDGLQPALPAAGQRQQRGTANTRPAHPAA